MNDAFFSGLQKFSGVLDYVDCVDVDVSAATVSEA